MSPVGAHGPVMTTGFPRVSGDEPTHGRQTLRGIEFSPRERG